MHAEAQQEGGAFGDRLPAASAAALRQSCGIDGVYTLFYYDDMPAATFWYEHIVGFRKVLDHGWLALFQVRGSAYLGLVSARFGSQRPVEGENRGVLLTIATEDLEGWHRRLFEKGVRGTGEGLQIGCDGLTIEFKVCDPGGYTLEFFEWLETPEALG